MPHVSPDRFPRGALIGAGALIGLTLLAAGTARLQAISAPAHPVIEALETRDLRFKDQADGSVAIYQAPGDRLVANLAPGTNGFMRALMRGLARERRMQGIGSEPPFRLISRRDGGLTLEDPATGRLVELRAFGPTNADAFARLLTSGRDDT
jgi:putative photosynthetic complex assembly protein